MSKMKISVHEHKNEDFDYGRVSTPIAQAYKVLDDHFCDNNGAFRQDAVDKVFLTFRNERDLYDRSKSKATKSHSLAWDALLRDIVYTLEWDDEVPHATKLSSEQVKNWFKLKGRNFQEDLKPLVDAIDRQRKKWWDEAGKKRSEKRTVTVPAVSYDVFTFDELSDQAKETAKDHVRDDILHWRGEDNSIFTEDCENAIAELFPNSSLNVQYSLNSCQGDGFNTYGKLKANDLLNVDLSLYPLNGSSIKPLSDKDAIKAVCDKADLYDIDLEENRHYCYSLADRIEVVPSYEAELTDDDVKLLNELEQFARAVMGRINHQFEDDGYKWFYEVTDEDIADEIAMRDYEFTEDGEIA